MHTQLSDAKFSLKKKRWYVAIVDSTASDKNYDQYIYFYQHLSLIGTWMDVINEMVNYFISMT